MYIISPVMYLTDDTESSGLSGAGWEDNSLQRACRYTESPYSPSINCRGASQGSTCVLRQEREPSPAQSPERLPRGQDCQEVDDEEEGERNVFLQFLYLHLEYSSQHKSTFTFMT